ncbi:bifunctional DNA primase/polymerase [Streptomyces sp. NPDC057910]|uniref:bifunctional DNA primase/polymerase n=1 Tax=Streptomyces sp. NPDC057910 TaxID=3346278 RepID=UPI0036E068E5
MAGEPARVAYWCARQGWPVFPLHPGHKVPRAGCGRCRRGDSRYVAHSYADCACIALGRWCHGFHSATKDPERIARWWRERPVPGVGVATGAAGLLVIDIDCHAQSGPNVLSRVLPGFEVSAKQAREVASGWDTWALLTNMCDSRAVETLTVATPNGGRHLWFRVPHGTQWASSAGGDHSGRSLGWQLDVRAQGGYIVAPGTHTSAGRYEALGRCRRPALLPGWLAGALERTGHLLRPQRSHSRTLPAPVPNLARRVAWGDCDSAWARSVATTALASVADCVHATEGSGWTNKLNRAAYTLGGLVAAGMLSNDQDAGRALLESALHARPQREREARRIIQAGLIAGKRRPLHPTKDR